MTTNTTTKPQDKFSEALETFLTRRQYLDNLPEGISPECDDAASDAFLAAEERLIAIPAQSVSDLRVKAEILWQETASLPNQTSIGHFFSDLHRLTGDETSRVFEPESWLRFWERNSGGYVEQGGAIVLVNAKPDDERTTDLLAELRWHGGEPAVKAIIRQQIAKRGDNAPTWGQLVSDYETAKARLDEHNATGEATKFGTPENTAHETKTDRLADEHDKALLALLTATPPDVVALAKQLAAYAESRQAGWDTDQEVAKHLAAHAEGIACA